MLVTNLLASHKNQSQLWEEFQFCCLKSAWKSEVSSYGDENNDFNELVSFEVTWKRIQLIVWRNLIEKRLIFYLVWCQIFIVWKESMNIFTPQFNLFIYKEIEIIENLIKFKVLKLFLNDICKV